MTQMIFVNIPVSDVARSKAFYEGIGFAINPQFSDEKANCVVVSETIFLMTLHRDYFATFTNKPVGNAGSETAFLLALSRDDRNAVDAIVARALAAGGSEPRPAVDHGFMYQRCFADPDGHMFEPFWMDPGAVEG
jgi:uncharacterized protein